MNRACKLLILIILMPVFATGCAKKASKPITQVIAFGDGLSDNGNALRILQNDIENGETDPSMLALDNFETRYEGRQSNGPLAVEILAEHLKVKLSDYAVVGATCDLNSLVVTGDMVNTGVLSQVNQFKEDLKGKKADPDGLYFISCSSGDWYAYLDDVSVENFEKYADKAVDDTMTAVEYLSGLGAKRFIVVNAYNLKIMPLVTLYGGGDRAQAFQTRYNSQLLSKMVELGKQLNTEITVFDQQAVSEKIVNTPQSYKITNLTGTCVDSNQTVCENPDEYYFWNIVYPTRKVHQIFGEAMAAVYGK
jgi:cholinesterase